MLPNLQLCGKIQFAIKDGVPYAIDFMNPAPDAELASVGEFYHNWITNAVTDLVFKRVTEKRERPRYRWDALLNPEPTRTEAVASATEQQSRTIVPNAEAKTATAVGKVGDTIDTQKSKTTPRTGTRKDERNSTRSKTT